MPQFIIFVLSTDSLDKELLQMSVASVIRLVKSVLDSVHDQIKCLDLPGDNSSWSLVDNLLVHHPRIFVATSFSLATLVLPLIAPSSSWTLVTRSHKAEYIFSVRSDCSLVTFIAATVASSPDLAVDCSVLHKLSVCFCSNSERCSPNKNENFLNW